MTAFSASLLPIPLPIVRGLSDRVFTEMLHHTCFPDDMLSDDVNPTISLAVYACVRPIPNKPPRTVSPSFHASTTLRYNRDYLDIKWFL